MSAGTCRVEFTPFIMRHVCGPDEPLQPILPAVSPRHAEHINTHMLQYEARLAKLTACRPGSGGVSSDAGGQLCPPWWLKRETEWRERASQAELRRLCTHARIWRDFLPRSRISLKKSPASVNGSIPIVGVFSSFDYFEPDYSCMSDERVPAHIGDGPKWICGAAALRRPCSLLALGSNFDDAFERAMYRRAGCRAYVVDPTLEFSGLVSGVHRGSGAATRTAAIARFADSLASYGASLNSSVGVGDPSKGKGTVAVAGSGFVHFRVVSMTSLLRDRYGSPPWHLDAVKIDIEGNEAPVLREMYALCDQGHLTIAQLNVEVHASPAWYHHSFRTFHELYDAFDGALSCGLVLHHKERNLWGCAEAQCMEYAWVSLGHAKREALATTGQLEQQHPPPQPPQAPLIVAHAARSLTSRSSGVKGGSGVGSSGPTQNATLLDILDASATPAVILEAMHGLGNRIRAYSSAKAIADANGYRLILLWGRDVHCNAQFGDLFQPDRGVAVVDHPDERIFSRSDVWAIRVNFSSLPPILLDRNGRELPAASPGGGPAANQPSGKLAGRLSGSSSSQRGKGGVNAGSQRPSGAKHVYVRSAVLLTPWDLGLPLKSFASPVGGKGAGSSPNCGPQCRVGVMTRAAARKLVPVPAVHDALRAMLLRAGLAAEHPLLAGGVPRQLSIHVRMASNLSEDVPNIGSEVDTKPWNGVRAMTDMPTHRERCTWHSFVAPALALIIPSAAANAASPLPTSPPRRLPSVYVAADIRGVAQKLCEALTAAVSARLSAATTSKALVADRSDQAHPHAALGTTGGSPSLRCVTAPGHLIDECFGDERRGPACQRVALAEALMLSRSNEMLYSDMSSYSWLTMALARNMRTKRSGCVPRPSATRA